MKLKIHPVNLSFLRVTAGHLDIDLGPVALMVICKVIIWIEAEIFNDDRSVIIRGIAGKYTGVYGIREIFSVLSGFFNAET